MKINALDPSLRPQHLALRVGAKMYEDRDSAWFGVLEWVRAIPNDRRQKIVVGIIVALTEVALVLFCLVVWDGFRLLADSNGLSGFERQEALRGQLTLAGTALAALVGLVFVVWNLRAKQLQAEAAHETRLTGVLAKAVEQLGAMRETGFKRVERVGAARIPPASGRNGEQSSEEKVISETRQLEPITEQRHGAIYALQRLAGDSERDAAAVSRLLTTFVRESLWAAGRLVIAGRELRSFEAGALLNDDVAAALSALGTAVRIAHRGETRRNGGHALVVPVPDLRGTRFDGATLQALHFFNIDLEGSSFADCRLIDVEFEACNLERSEFRGARIERTDFVDALDEPRLVSKLTKARFVGASLITAHFKNCRLDEVFFQETIFRDVRFVGSTLDKAKFLNCEVSPDGRVDFELSTSLNGAWLYMQHMGGFHFADTSLDNAHFEFRGLTKARIACGCSFKNASFRWADLTGVDFATSDLCGANFDHAMIPGADMGRTREVPRELRSAYADAETTPPKSMTALRFDHVLAAESDEAERQRWVEGWRHDRELTEEDERPSPPEEEG